MNYPRLQLKLPHTVTVAFVLSISCAFVLASIIAASQTQSADIWSKLQRNNPGYVVMMRHADAPGIGDPQNFQLGDCSTQRNLSATGQAQAKRIGETFRRYNIQVARILSSQWCRCLDTARLMNLGKVEEFPAINSFFRDRSNDTKQTTAVRKFILDNRNAKGAIILVTHQVNVTALTDFVPQEGEAVVLRGSPQGNNVELVGRISAN